MASFPSFVLPGVRGWKAPAAVGPRFGDGTDFSLVYNPKAL